MQPTDVVNFWFAPAHEPLWFEPSPAFDRELGSRFGELYRRAAAGELDHWQRGADGSLALCLLLDQFPRNLFRGSAQAFATDARALAVVEHAIARGFDQELPAKRRLFLYLPFEHSEDLAHQERAVELIGALGDAGWLDYAIRHRDIIARFGRFPHRNEVLGRASTPEEMVFLEQPGSSF